MLVALFANTSVTVTDLRNKSKKLYSQAFKKGVNM